MYVKALKDNSYFVFFVQLKFKSLETWHTQFNCLAIVRGNYFYVYHWNHQFKKVFISHLHLQTRLQNPNSFRLLLSDRWTMKSWGDSWGSVSGTNRGSPPTCPRSPERRDEPGRPRSPTVGGQCNPWTRPEIEILILNKCSNVHWGRDSNPPSGGFFKNAVNI